MNGSPQTSSNSRRLIPLGVLLQTQTKDKHPMNPAFPNLALVGIDVSKLTFDACLLRSAGPKLSAQFSNNPEGFAKLDTWLKAHHATKVLAGLEATGPYGVPLLWHLHTQGHVTCQLNPRRIKDYARSQG